MIRSCKDVPWITEHCPACHRWLARNDAVLARSGSALNLGKHEGECLSCCCWAYDLLYPGSQPGALCANNIARIDGEPEVYTFD